MVEKVAAGAPRLERGFMIWLHEGRVVKWSEMSQPTVVRADGRGEEKPGQEGQNVI